MSRATKAYASAYQPGRVHESRIAVGESRALECDVNGALNGETIVSARCANDNPAAFTLSGLSQEGGLLSVTVTGATSGRGQVLMLATTSAGRVIGQQFDLCVTPSIADADALTWAAP